MLEFLGGILAAGLALVLASTIVGIVLLGLVIWGISSVVKRITGKSGGAKNLPSGESGMAKRDMVQPARVAKDYTYLDVEDGATPGAVREAVRPYEGAPYVGEYARSVMTTLDKSEFRRKGLFSALEREFSPNTITWDKFATPIEVAMDGILQNCTHLANRIQGFDTAEYGRLSRLVKAGACTEGSNNWQRWELLGKSLKEMGEIRQGNEQLLFELEKLENELMKLDDGGASTTSDIAEEIRNLTEEAKYYS